MIRKGNRVSVEDITGEFLERKGDVAYVKIEGTSERLIKEYDFSELEKAPLKFKRQHSNQAELCMIANYINK